MGTASAVSPTLSGHATVAGLVILVRCFLTYRANINSLSRIKGKRYIAKVTGDHSLVTVSYLQMNNSMVIITANQVHMREVTRSLSKMTRTC